MLLYKRRLMKPSMLFGYTKREDGLYEKTIHFGERETKMIRDVSGRLIKAETPVGQPPVTSLKPYRPD